VLLYSQDNTLRSSLQTCCRQGAGLRQSILADRALEALQTFNSHAEWSGRSGVRRAFERDPPLSERVGMCLPSFATS
jgi:hypothetical protein